jgi:hypothetical protein
MMGDTPSIRIIRENILAFSSTGNISRMMALGATMPTQPPSAWKNLKKIRTWIEFETTQPAMQRYKVTTQ